MKKMTVGDFKAKFSVVVDLVLQGESVEVTYGRKKEVIATLVPKLKKKGLRKIGICDNTPGFYMAPDFSTTTNEDFPIDDY